MARQIVIVIVLGIGFTALSLFWRYTNIDSEFRGAPFTFVQSGTTFSLNTTHHIYFGMLFLDIFIYFLLVFLFFALHFFEAKKHRQHIVDSEISDQFSNRFSVTILREGEIPTRP